MKTSAFSNCSSLLLSISSHDPLRGFSGVDYWLAVSSIIVVSSFFMKPKRILAIESCARPEDMQETIREETIAVKLN